MIRYRIQLKVGRQRWQDLDVKGAFKTKVKLKARLKELRAKYADDKFRAVKYVEKVLEI